MIPQAFGDAYFKFWYVHLSSHTPLCVLGAICKYFEVTVLSITHPYTGSQLPFIHSPFSFHVKDAHVNLYIKLQPLRNSANWTELCELHGIHSIYFSPSPVHPNPPLLNLEYSQQLYIILAAKLYSLLPLSLIQYASDILTLLISKGVLPASISSA